RVSVGGRRRPGRSRGGLGGGGRRGPGWGGGGHRVRGGFVRPPPAGRWRRARAGGGRPAGGAADWRAMRSRSAASFASRHRSLDPTGRSRGTCSSKLAAGGGGPPGSRGGAV